jgi:hypothetical protein
MAFDFVVDVEDDYSMPPEEAEGEVLFDPSSKSRSSQSMTAPMAATTWRWLELVHRLA